MNNNADSSLINALGFDDSSLVTFDKNNMDSDPLFGELNFADINQDESNDIRSLADPVAMGIDS